MKRTLILLGFALMLTACGSVKGGPGWELLAFDRSGPVYSVLIAHDQDDLDHIWDRFDLPIAKPSVDFDEQVVIGLGHAVSSSCPEITFRGLVIDDNRVYGKYRVGKFMLTGGCTLDATSAMFWLAVDRRALPDQFTLSLTEEKICRSCLEETSVVDMKNPDPSPWWDLPRLGVALEGDPQEHFVIHPVPDDGYDGPMLSVPPGGAWWIRPGRITMIFDKQHPDRLEVFSATCPSGQCADGLGLIRGELRCSVAIALQNREDYTATIKFDPNGDCSTKLTSGLDWPR